MSENKTDSPQPETIPDDIPEPTTPHAGTNAAEEILDLIQTHEIISSMVSAEMAKAIASSYPEEARIAAMSPYGYQVMLITRKQNPADLIVAVQKMQEWLKASGYTSNEIPF